MNEFKMAVPVNQKAWENWKAFAKNLLTHKNPYTRLRWADDPGVPWLSMINEGTFGNYINGLEERVKRDWRARYNTWLARKYRSRQALQKAWGEDPGGDPAAGTVDFSGNIWADAPRDRDLAVFTAEVERDMFSRMKKFLRNEVRTQVLLTNMNAWTNRVATQAARVDYDYVDDHFYVDHPQFLERDWQLPSKSPNTNPIVEGAPGGRSNAFVRLFGKPFTVSEYNYSGPGRFRGVGGILTGALAATQDWDAVWRFAYSHSRENVISPGPAGYFDLATDPLNQAAERATIALYLRGDMQPAAHAVAIAMTEQEALELAQHNHPIAPEWNSLAWVTRVGSVVARQPGAFGADVMVPLGWSGPRKSWGGAMAMDADPYSPGAGKTVLDRMRQQGWLGERGVDLTLNLLQSENKQLTIDAPRGVMLIDTPRTAGGYTRAGERIQTDAVTISILETDATVWASSLDGQPIRRSRHLLITHLTDLQNTGARFADRARTTLLDWGKLPHLVRTGAARITLRIANPERAKVWALSTGGRRLAQVGSALQSGALEVPLDIAGAEGARILYEVAVD
jgi:hypothetical protein